MGQAGDIRPDFREDSAESQSAEGGTNWNDNCVPTSFAMVMDALGYGDPEEPQDWTDYEYGADYHGTESGDRAIDFITSHPQQYPNPPGMWHEAPADVAARVRDLLDQRKPTVAYFSCARDATIGPGTYGHASVPVAHDGAGIAVWNVWTGYEQYFSFADFNRYSLGSICVFDRVVDRTVAVPPAQNIPLPEETMRVDFKLITTGPAGEEVVPAFDTPFDINLACDEKGGAQVELWVREYQGGELHHDTVAVPSDNEYAASSDDFGIPKGKSVIVKFILDSGNTVHGVVH